MEEIVENTSTETKGKKSKKEKASKAALSFKTHISNLSYGGGTLLFVILASFVVVIIACLAVFFANVQGEERVMVPNVVGKPLTTALFEMQEKELYPELQMRYSDVPGEAGLVLEQNPKSGAIVKAYRKVTITVSRGVQTTVLDNYVGQKLDTVKSAIEREYSGERPLITVKKSFQKSKEPYGTIIAQYPVEGYPIAEATNLYFVVSSGDMSVTTNIPSINNYTIDQILKNYSSYNVIFDFTSHEASGSEKENTVVKVTTPKESSVPYYTRVPAELALKNTDTAIAGIFKQDIQAYPYPVKMKLELTDPEGKTTVLTEFSHPGNELTLPYLAPSGSVLKLYVLDELYAQEFVN